MTDIKLVPNDKVIRNILMGIMCGAVVAGCGPSAEERRAKAMSEIVPLQMECNSLKSSDWDSVKNDPKYVQANEMIAIAKGMFDKDMLDEAKVKYEEALTLCRSLTPQVVSNLISVAVKEIEDRSRMSRGAEKWRSIIKEANDKIKFAFSMQMGRAEYEAAMKKVVEDAEAHLHPKMRIKCKLGETFVDGANYSIGKKFYQTPEEVDLVVGEIVPGVSIDYGKDGTNYSARVGKIIPDWMGCKEFVVDLMPTPNAGESGFVELPHGVSIEMVWCPKGSLKIEYKEQNGDAKVADLCVDHGYWISKYELTKRQAWSIRTLKWPDDARPNGKEIDLPADRSGDFHGNIGDEFFKLLNQCQTNVVFRNPTALEWEYALRYGGFEVTPDNFNEYAVSFLQKPKSTLPSEGLFDRSVKKRDVQKVGTKKANKLGLYDMLGNAAEVVSDSMEVYLGLRNPIASPPYLKGGSWSQGFEGATALLASQSARWNEKYIGFRLVADYNGPLCKEVAKTIATPEVGSNWKSPSTGMQFVWVESLKGWVGMYEVSNAEFRKFKQEHDSGKYKEFSLNGDRQPVVQVTFADAEYFCDFMNKNDQDSLGDLYRYQLPTEEQYVQYATCGDGRTYPWGGAYDSESIGGNYADASAAQVFQGRKLLANYDDGHPVSCNVEDSWKNSLGLYGVGGNVWEICYKVDKDHKVMRPPRLGSYGEIVWRGASWFYSKDDVLRNDYRFVYLPKTKGIDMGFRLVLMAK